MHTSYVGYDSFYGRWPGIAVTRCIQ